MNNTKQKYKSPETILDILAKFAQDWEDKMEDAEGIEKAFIFGHINMAAALTYTIEHPGKPMHICMEYKRALQAYKEATEEVMGDTSFEKELEKLGFKQITLDDIVPLLDALKDSLSKSKNASRNTRKPKSKQE